MQTPPPSHPPQSDPQRSTRWLRIQRWVDYRYEVGGREYRWNVAAGKAPDRVGAPLPIVYLPENPKEHRVGSPPDEGVIAREVRASRRVVYALLALFAASLVANEYQIHRRLRLGQPPGVGIPPTGR